MKFMKWLVTSSADPTRYSKMVVGALSMGGVAHSAHPRVRAVCTSSALTKRTVARSSILARPWSVPLTSYGLGRKIWLNRISAYPPADVPIA
jgi:hypothetical protein